MMMRKRIVDQKELTKGEEGRPDVLDVEHLAEVEVTSEDPDHPIEHARLAKYSSGWRACEPGTQTIRLWFDQPQDISRIYLHFIERQTERTQEYVLRWAENRHMTPIEIVRQQWNFSPSGSRHEIEDYHVSLEGVSLIELEVTPAIGGSDIYASLHQFYLS